MAGEIVLVDVGTGNLHSVRNALERVGAEVKVTDKAEDLVPGARLVLPGVGAFGNFMAGLRERGLEAGLGEAVRRGDPLLGICVGMQALFEVGEELGEFRGLGLLCGRVKRFPEGSGLKIPHTGWNQVWPVRGSRLLRGLREGCFAYFNHAYFCEASEEGDCLAMTEYGVRYASVVERGNLMGVQFHPEKSQAVGLRFLENFVWT
jgi:imidazole glycerol-phosphate synthase subunit HisH